MGLRPERSEVPYCAICGSLRGSAKAGQSFFHKADDHVPVPLGHLTSRGCPICFSATASFTAGIALLGIGSITVRRTHEWVEVPYAAVPLIFGVQQLVEGLLWRNLPAQDTATHVLTIVYLLFSNVLWPIYVPVAVWLLEPRSARRRTIVLTIAAGSAVGLFFLAAIIAHPVTSAIKGMHIKYHVPHHHDAIAVAVYAAATCLAPLLSTHKMVRLFGIVLTASMIVAATIYLRWFASVWCFFAAVVSAMVLLHFWRGRTPQKDGCRG